MVADTDWTPEKLCRHWIEFTQCDNKCSMCEHTCQQHDCDADSECQVSGCGCKCWAEGDCYD